MQGQPSSSASRRPDFTCLEAVNVAFLTRGPYSFTVCAGECVGLSGKSGIGKTQLLRALADLIPYSGTVFFNGVSADKISAPNWRQRVGMVPADPCWWYDSVGEHFTQKGNPENLKSTLARLGFELDVLNWEVSRLSTGERQRLALARALVPDPDVLLLDEPSSALDAFYTGRLEELLAELRRSRKLGIVWVSHDPAQLKRVASRIFAVEEHGLSEVVAG